MSAVRATLALVLAVAAGAAAYEGAWLGVASAQGIFTCIDGKGRKLTSDRPIPECVDREQKELNASGTVRRNVGPTLTAQELAAEEERARKASQDQNRRSEERRRERVLLARYPDKASHDRVRAESLVQIDEVIKTANNQIVLLIKQRKNLDNEMEFFKANPAKAPPALKRQFDENDANLSAQKRFIVDQEAEKNRVHARFDEELTKLKPLWQASASAVR